jgi:hypothetical protein
MWQNRRQMTRREALRILPVLPGLSVVAVRLTAQSKPAPTPVAERPDTFKIYTDAPRLLLRPQRLKLLRRERERRSLRWDQFEALWTGKAQFPELGWVEAMRFQLADDREAASRAIAWALGPADAAKPDDVRQMAIIADWCEPLLTKSSDDARRQLSAKLEKAASDPRPVRSLNEARARIFAATALTDTQPAVSQKALQTVFDGFWTASFIPALRTAKASVSNADAYAMLEIMHAVRDNLNFDLRDTFPAWFGQHPLLHLLAHYPAPWPASDNEFHIPADEMIEKTGPDLRKATLSRAAELAMVAYDSNAASSQLLQGWLMNDRYLMRGTFGLPYELLWANPYQPGLSYYHVPLAMHDEIGGQLFVRSSWEDDAEWAGFFGGQLQLFNDGAVTRVDPAASREPIDLSAAMVFFARASKKFAVPAPAAPQQAQRADAPVETSAGGFAVFIVGLEAGRSYHVEVDGEEMFEEKADPGGIVFLPSVVPGGVRLGPVPG